ncbi:Putative zinc metalloprotease Rip3 [Bremerella volcania]|uniref:Zinc metalloprotease n=1 Tax=Bremerella volcania TaxID=2527984 RepID=A0A518C5R5_9BACT|nr:site-2 protease family protein [Bremerella volcania]QDU74567.1 Putative zinc metalloprotease Rip3 [Bremerella volcania]
MKWSLKVAQIAGIGIYIHWTFFLLLGWIALIHLNDPTGPLGVAESVGFVLAIFGCIVLHELGHALTAQRFRIKTRDITLLPIGGVARLEHMPKEPRKELLVAVAGPAVNFVIAGVLYGVAMSRGSIAPLSAMWATDAPFLDRLMWINLVLGLFNLLPGFPMDGGRVLRALLGFRMSFEQATDIAAQVGQMTAIMFAMIGFFSNWFLLFIALFVYMGAQAEAQMVHVRSMIRGVPVRDAMLRQFTVLSGNDTLGHAVDHILAGSQQGFPVTEDGQLLGILPRNDLLKSVALHGRDKHVDEIMRQQCETIEDDEPLDKTLERMQQGDCAMFPVVNEGQLVGVITADNIGEWLMTRAKQRDANR